MKNLFKPEMFKKILSVLILFLMLKLVWFIVEVFWLPATDIDQEVEQGGKSLYYRVKLTPNAAPAPKKMVIKQPTRKVSGSIRDITLLAIYNASDTTVITVSHKKKTKVLGLGENINGFVLEGAGNNFATFSKDAKTYRVELSKIAKNKNNIVAVTNTSPSKVKAETKPEGQVTDVGNHRIIDRSLFEHYAKNMDDIYKNIGVTEVKEGKNLKGFQISFVKRDSDFSKLGLRRNDVIKSINGQEINSYNAALGVYKNIESADNLSLIIKRGKEEMELEYEIN